MKDVHYCEFLGNPFLNPLLLRNHTWSSSEIYHPSCLIVHSTKALHAPHSDEDRTNALAVISITFPARDQLRSLDYTAFCSSKGGCSLGCCCGSGVLSCSSSGGGEGGGCCCSVGAEFRIFFWGGCGDATCCSSGLGISFLSLGWISSAGVSLQQKYCCQIFLKAVRNFLMRKA